MKKILATFSGGSYELRLSQKSLEEQSKTYFDGVASYNENTPDVIRFIHSNPQIFKYRRGYGYWSWKPFVIYNTLKNVNDGDFVFYIDSGNDIVDDISVLFDICKENNGFCLFENRSGHPAFGIWSNGEWTKYDCFYKMNCLGEKYINGNQIDAGYQLYQKNEQTMKFVEEYLKYSVDNEIITDEKSKHGKDLPEFRDHRHDQSIVSLLAIKYNIKTFPEPSEAGDPVRKPGDRYGRLFLHHRGTRHGRR